MPRSIRQEIDAFRVMADCSPVMIWVTDAQGELTFVNKAYRGFFGVSDEDVAHLDWRTLVHPEDCGQSIRGFLEAVGSRASYRGKCRVRDATGEWRWVMSYGGPFFSESGEFLGMVGSSPDVTDQVNAEAALRENEERFRLALQGMPVIVFSADRDLRYTWIYNVMPGLQRADFIGHTDNELMSEADAAPIMALKRRVLTRGTRERGEFKIEVGGRTLVYDATIEPIIEAMAPSAASEALQPRSRSASEQSSAYGMRTEAKRS
jgi:PAS domain S-box-containing protein